MTNMNKLKLIKKIPVLALIIISCLMLFKGCTNSSQAKGNTLVVGMMSGWPPYMSTNNEGGFEGFDVDVTKEVAKRLGKKLIINDIGSLESLFIALDRNKIDLLFSGLDITKKRLNMYNMTQYTGEGIESFYLLFWNKVPTGISTIDDLKQLDKNIVCVEPASPSENFLLQARFEGIEKKSINKVIDMVLELKYGKSLAAILEPIAALEIMKKNPDLKYIKVPIPPEFQIFGVGIAMKKNNIKLKKQVDKAIDSMRSDGTLRKLEQRWSLPGVQS